MKQLNTVLLIDDDLNISELIRINLELDGLRTTCSENGRAGILAAQELKPDLILLDMMLPDGDGISVLRQLKKIPETADIPVLMLSARSQIPDMEKAIQYGAVDYLLKPFDPIGLSKKLEDSFGQFHSGKGYCYAD
jgi:DNA-binding response OmpR family regulator